MRPMVAAVAAEEPETAAKIAQPRTLTCSSRPGTRPSQGASPENMSCDRRERSRISPIRMNSGSEASDQECECPQRLVASTSPCGASAKTVMAKSASASSDTATQVPAASSTISTASRIEKTTGSDIRLLLHRR